MPFMVLVCLLLTACDKDDVLPARPMEWSYEIITPANVQFLKSTTDVSPSYFFETNGKGGDMVMTCDNYDVLNPISGDSYVYDCGWTTLKIEGNQVKIHFAPSTPDDVALTHEEIQISANDGDRKVYTLIGFSRVINEEGTTDPQPEGLPEEAKFKMIMSEYTPFMRIESPLPAPLDLITFRITDINGEYSPIDIPEFTHYYDSIVWSADDFPHTFKVFEYEASAKGSETHITTQWSSHFFKSGTVNSHLKGYRDGKVKYETSHRITLYDRDFLGLEWGTVILQKPTNLTAHCLLDRDYEYKLYDIVAKDYAPYSPYSRFVPVNHQLLPEAEFLPTTKKAVMTLMENSLGAGENANGKESLFKCLPEKGVVAERYWENETTRMLMLHRLPDEEGLAEESYYLHIEPK